MSSAKFGVVSAIPGLGCARLRSSPGVSQFELLSDHLLGLAEGPSLNAAPNPKSAMPEASPYHRRRFVPPYHRPPSLPFFEVDREKSNIGWGNSADSSSLA
jgi:hypothetical protein